MYIVDGLRSPFRISYGYLYPMAIDTGLSDAWFQRARAVPEYGMLAMRMYNDPWRNQGPPSDPYSDVDLIRFQKTIYRICMDGSFHVRHSHLDCICGSCSVDECFGEFNLVGP